MEILVGILLNLSLASLVYILLRRRIDARYTQKAFLEQIEKEVGQIVTDMNQTTERNIQLLENKLEAVKTLMEKSQQVLVRGNAELNSLQDRYQQYRRFAAVPAPGGLAQEGSTALQKNPPPNMTRLADQAQAPPKDSVQNPPSDSKKPKREELKQMATDLYIKGEELGAISEKTGLSLGEVELIVALIRR